MRVIAKRTLRLFWEEHPQGREARAALEAWHATVTAADWRTPADVKSTYATASVLKSNRIVFNIAGNRFRLVVKVNFSYRVVYVRFIGTHEAYGRIDAKTI